MVKELDSFAAGGTTLTSGKLRKDGLKLRNEII